MQGRILIVDTESGVREYLGQALEHHGHRVSLADDSEAALQTLLRGGIEVALIEVFLRGEHGLELLRHIKNTLPAVEVVLTGLGLPPSATTSLLNEGAFAFLHKPLDMDLTLATVDKALEVGRVRTNNRALEAILKLSVALDLPATAAADEAWIEPLQLAAQTDLPVLLSGEAGVEKSGYAALLHTLSPRNGQPFFEVQCQDSEAGFALLGSSDQDQTTPALISLIAGGSLLFKDVEVLSDEAQKRLGELLKTRSLRGPGGRRDPVTTRIIATTEDPSAELQPLLQEQLGRVHIKIPPLRERREAIPDLIRQLLKRSSRSNIRMSEEAITQLQDYRWPGNLRELRFVLEGLLLSGKSAISPGDLPSALSPVRPMTDTSDDSSLSLADIEARHIARVLKKQGGNKVRTARVLDINVKTLYNKIRVYGLEDAKR